METVYNSLNELPKHQVLTTLLQPERSVTLSSEELQELITAAQNNDSAAIQRLYEGFLLLIFDLTQEEFIYSQLKEDAVGIAVEAFLQLVQSYKGPDYYHFPGLVRKVVRSRLFRAINKKELREEPIESYEQQLDNGFDIPDSKDETAELLNEIECQELLQGLPPEAQLLLYRYFYLDIPLKQQAKEAGVSLRTLERKYQKALEQLRRYQM